MITVAADHTVRAAKKHECVLCSRIIEKSERYVSETIFNGGPPERIATCWHCHIFYPSFHADASSRIIDYSAYDRPVWVPANDWDGDIPDGWEKIIAAWLNCWLDPEGQLFDIANMPTIEKETS